MDSGAATEAETKVDWQFARRPFWVFSHLFAFTVVSVFIVLGFWQLNRLGERQQANAVVESRVAEPIELVAAPDGGVDGSDLDYQAVDVRMVYLFADFARIANRSQGGAAGFHVVAIAELPDRSKLAVNRGFVPGNADVSLEPVPTGWISVSGWLRKSVEQESFGATDTGEGTVLPRFDTEQIADRLGVALPNVWLQLASPDRPGLVTFPDPVPLPPIDDGPHLSYAVQWFIFATLGILFYLALLRRQSRGNESTPTYVPPPE